MIFEISNNMTKEDASRLLIAAKTAASWNTNDDTTFRPLFGDRLNHINCELLAAGLAPLTDEEDRWMRAPAEFARTSSK